MDRQVFIKHKKIKLGWEYINGPPKKYVVFDSSDFHLLGSRLFLYSCQVGNLTSEEITKQVAEKEESINAKLKNKFI